jgi:hypothetical protein
VNGRFPTRTCSITPVHCSLFTVHVSGFSCAQSYSSTPPPSVPRSRAWSHPSSGPDPWPWRLRAPTAPSSWPSRPRLGWRGWSEECRCARRSGSAPISSFFHPIRGSTRARPALYMKFSGPTLPLSSPAVTAMRFSISPAPAGSLVHHRMSPRASGGRRSSGSDFPSRSGLPPISW